MNKSTVWLTIFFAVLIWSGIEPKDSFTWFLEVVPALIALPILFVTRKKFPLTSLAYGLILIHAIILMVGGHYTYAEVPLFDTIADWMGSERNNYDKVGHFAQGFIPALLAREVFLRLEVVKKGAWCNFLVCCFALALSAFYELIEWWVALATGEDAEAFLGTQGYVWDTQSDMGMALIGALASVILLSRWHDSLLLKLKKQ
ncbi:DUF2238 domain-containing protein [Shewanella rhizosphaerae]|uniref:DUF2238 domain-containing protein n=1 Tax=Shewanella TaxID=22 RepID=UPI001C6561C9|nr:MULTISPECIES: DUF2238 domain-containing protein [Shewanella]QYJ97071.1 DUF2238 domain-containing protein [Shewanella alkalitolerans]QYK12323.1 DUF2238 domain-containing protein [Shewanella rhizosphaerae]